MCFCQYGIQETSKGIQDLEKIIAVEGGIYLLENKRHGLKEAAIRGKRKWFSLHLGGRCSVWM